MSFESDVAQSNQEAAASTDNIASSSPPGTQRLLFVIGLWRSGTSLVYALLNQHPEIALLYEAEPLELWPRSSLLVPARNWPQRLEFYNQTFTRHRLPMQPLASMRPGPEAAMALYRKYARKRNAVIMGGKAPSYHTRLPMLSNLFPDAQFLIIWRDPLDCCRSAARAACQSRFFARRGMLTRILFGAEAMAKGVESLLCEKRNVCQVLYEELLKNPEEEIRRVCEFLKIPYSPTMLDLETADFSSVPSGEHHAGVRSGVMGKTEEAEEVLSADFIAKGQRYAKLWKTRFSQLGFARALADEAPAPPHPVERLADFCVIKFWRMTDGFKTFLFRWIPLSWWAQLRSRPRLKERP